MANLSSFLSDFLSCDGGKRGYGRSHLGLKKKKSYMVDIMGEVSRQLESSDIKFDDATVARIDSLKKEFGELAQRRTDVTEKLQVVRARLKSATKTSKGLNRQHVNADKEMANLTGLLDNLKKEDERLEEERELDMKIQMLRGSVGLLEEELAPTGQIVSMRDELESKIASLVESRIALNRQLAASARTLEDFRRELPALGEKKSDTEKQLEQARLIQKQFDAACDERDRLNGEGSELSDLAADGKQELNGLEDGLKELEGALGERQGKKGTLKKKIAELDERRAKAEKLNSEIGPLASAQAALKNRLDGLEKDAASVRKDKETLEGLRRDKLSLLGECDAFREETRPIVAALEKVERLEERSGNEKAKYEKIIERIPSVRRSIQKMEVCGAAYKAGFVKLAEATL